MTYIADLHHRLDKYLLKSELKKTFFENLKKEKTN